MLYKNTPTNELGRPIAAAFLYGFLYLYSFVVANQITGIAEDKVNKPDRPLASGATTPRAATLRYYTLTALYLAYSHLLGVEKWSLLWAATTYAHNFLAFADFGPTKDACMGAGAIAQLMAAWAIGGADPQMGWAWTKVIAVYMSWPIPLQDLRDVPGDRKTGRRTTPIILGDTMGVYSALYGLEVDMYCTARVHITAGILVSQYLLIRYRILEHRSDAAGIAVAGVVALLSMIVVVRLFAFKTLYGDRISYWYYTALYVLQPIAACITLKAH